MDFNNLESAQVRGDMANFSGSKTRDSRTNSYNGGLNVIIIIRGSGTRI